MQRILALSGAPILCTALAATIVFAGPAAGQSVPTATCTPPPAMPSTDLRPPPAPVKPVTPGCVDEKTHMAHCRDAELKRFNAAVDRFNADIAQWNKVSGDYVDQLNAWTQGVSRYSLCEVNAINAQAPH